MVRNEKVKGGNAVNVRPVLTAFAAAAVLGTASGAWAQWSSGRSFGRSLSAQTGPSSTEIGFLRGNERYLRGGAPVASRFSTFTKMSLRGDEVYVRGNRRKTDFVGTDSQEANDFVGSPSGESKGQVKSGKTKRQTTSKRDVGRQPSRPQPTKPMFRPQLSVDFDFRPLPLQQVGTDLGAQLEASLIRHSESAVPVGRNGSIDVSLKGQTATLRGEVSSERERTLAELLSLLEPGVSKVENKLVVKRRSASAPKAAPRSSSEPAEPAADEEDDRKNVDD